MTLVVNVNLAMCKPFMYIELHLCQIRLVAAQFLRTKIISTITVASSAKISKTQNARIALMLPLLSEVA